MKMEMAICVRPCLNAKRVKIPDYMLSMDMEFQSIYRGDINCVLRNKNIALSQFCGYPV